jgi:hypothetical protein
MNQKELTRAAQELLGFSATLEEIGRQHHNGTGKLYTFRVQGYPTDHRFLLKMYEAGPAIDEKMALLMAHREGKALWNIQDISDFRAPTYYGASGNMILMGRVSGELFDTIRANPVDPDVLADIYAQATVTLALVHSSIDQIKDRRFLPGRFSIETMHRTLHEQVRIIRTTGFANYEAKGFELGAGWANAMAKLPDSIYRVIEDLAVTSGDYFLSQGDFKPDNLMVMPNGEICVLDWAGVCKAKPWYDLAYLLLDVPRPNWDSYIELYLATMQDRGYLRGLTVADAWPKLNSGAIYQQLARAKANVAYIASRANPHHSNEFREALNGLTELMS